MFEEVTDGEVSKLIYGVCLLVVDPGDTFDRRKNVRLHSDPCRFAK